MSLNCETFSILLLRTGVQTSNRDGLDGDDSVKFGIAGAIHHSHGATSKFGVNFVSIQLCAHAGFHFLVVLDGMVWAERSRVCS